MFKENQNAPRPSEHPPVRGEKMSKRLGRIKKGCFLFFPFILDARLVDVPAGVTQEEGHTGFLIYLPSAGLALIFLARRTPPFRSLVDREVEFCALAFILFYFCVWKNPSYRDSNSLPNVRRVTN